MARDRLHELAEERSLALHRAIAERIRRDPSIVGRARDRVDGWLADRSVAEPYARRWKALLDGPREALLAALVDQGQAARDLRQTTPFAFVVPPRERWRLWRETRERWERGG